MSLFLHELEAEQRLYWRSRELAFFTFLFPKTHLSVTAKGFPSVRDPATLHQADTLQEYESRKAEEIFHFRVQAQ